MRGGWNWILSCFSVTIVAAQTSNNATTKWLTLNGDAPLVIARGGFSGLFPDSSYDAYMMAMGTSLANVIICKYFVNGVPTLGWFSIDFNFKDLAPVTLRQGVYSRTERFDESQRGTLSGCGKPSQTSGLWLNIQHDTFFSQHNLTMIPYLSICPLLTMMTSLWIRLLSDFPVTPSATIDCFTHLDKNDKTQKVKLLIITSEGASGDYPGCTDLAYTKAALDGADVLDCPVQMTKDGIPFCLGSINLIDKTTVSQSPFHNIASTVPELNITSGIVSFNLTWDEIRGRPETGNNKPMLTWQIRDSVVFAAVLEALRSAGYDNQTAKKVMIQSKDNSYVEINNYIAGAGIDGVITDFPGTAARYRTEAPNPILTESDVVEPPLPPVAKIIPTAGNNSATANAAPTSPIGHSSVGAGILACCLSILLADLGIF
ncbi:hypothetical protein HAX54_036758 [Datura stramonium]|uniref:glycerophosphodiester phosphodiesterase n=1 Tax=Datura stramonium TaxID=4076 RepID=A0ABS8VHC5_DATST|nr:hypothetical protein [Datura stramonium]